MSITQKSLEPHPIACPYFKALLTSPRHSGYLSKKNMVSVTTFDTPYLCAELVTQEATGGFC